MLLSTGEGDKDKIPIDLCLLINVGDDFYLDTGLLLQHEVNRHGLEF